MAWEITQTREATAWMRGLSARDRHALTTTLEALQVYGPELGRPLADRIKESRYHNMKELRPPCTNLRALFAFDPQRRAVLLLGGDKTNNWRGWYRTNIPKADRLYDQHLRNMGKGGPCPNPRNGGRSSGR